MMAEWEAPLSREVSIYNDYSTLGLGDTAAHNKGMYYAHDQRCRSCL